MGTTLSKQNAKKNGVHYTPPALARFLARQTVAAYLSGQSQNDSAPIQVLDPACGDGELLASVIACLRALIPHASIDITGFDTDAVAVKSTHARLNAISSKKRAKATLNVAIKKRDFLETTISRKFDLVIANPPYVRTQVLGGKTSQRLGKKFDLTGRVDLYHAFAAAITDAAKSGGVIGLLTSNRFLSVKSGASMRSLLSSEYCLHHIFDLGDTRLFEAAVLPAIIIGTKRSTENGARKAAAIKFHRIYRSIEPEKISPAHQIPLNDKTVEPLIQAIEDFQTKGKIKTELGSFLIDRGELRSTDATVWTLTNRRTRAWLNTVRKAQTTTFGELADIKVGIKTTADSVFIRENWKELGQSKPEPKLLKPLITHHDAVRWAIEKPKKRVLYPYDLRKKKREALEIKKFPRASAYLESHRQRLEGRKYVIDSGRRWYEIWVAHQPTGWAKPKIVWPDISESPKFFLDESGAIVNGDCYWLKLRTDIDQDWLYLMLAVANSSVATRFYDTQFHNKLYANRRRFMTQYVKEFPLPELSSKIGKQLVRHVKTLVERPTPKLELKVESLVQKSFGF